MSNPKPFVKHIGDWFSELIQIKGATPTTSYESSTRLRGMLLARVVVLRGCSSCAGARRCLGAVQPDHHVFAFVCVCVCVCVRACVCVCLSVLLVCLCFSVSDIVVLRQMFLVRFLQLLFPVVSFRFWFTLGSKVTPSSSVKRRF